jgi:hypothetical protein
MRTNFSLDVTKVPQAAKLVVMFKSIYLLGFRPAQRQTAARRDWSSIKTILL